MWVEKQSFISFTCDLKFTIAEFKQFTLAHCDHCLICSYWVLKGIKAHTRTDKKFFEKTFSWFKLLNSNFFKLFNVSELESKFWIFKSLMLVSHRPLNIRLWRCTLQQLPQRFLFLPLYKTVEKTIAVIKKKC